MEDLRRELAQHEQHEELLLSEVQAAASMGMSLMAQNEEMQRELANKEELYDQAVQELQDLEETRGDAGLPMAHSVSLLSRKRTRSSSIASRASARLSNVSTAETAKLSRFSSSFRESAFDIPSHGRMKSFKAAPEDADETEEKFQEVVLQNTALENEKRRLEMEKLDILAELGQQQHVMKELAAGKKEDSEFQAASEAAESAALILQESLAEHEMLREALKEQQQLYMDIEERLELTEGEMNDQLEDVQDSLAEAEAQTTEMKEHIEKNDVALQHERQKNEDIEEELDDMRELLDHEKFKNSAARMRMTVVARKSMAAGAGGVLALGGFGPAFAKTLSKGAEDSIDNATALAAELAASDDEEDETEAEEEEDEREFPELVAEKKRLLRRLETVQQQAADLERGHDADLQSAFNRSIADAVQDWATSCMGEDPEHEEAAEEDPAPMTKLEKEIKSLRDAVSSGELVKTRLAQQRSQQALRRDTFQTWHEMTAEAGRSRRTELQNEVAEARQQLLVVRDAEAHLAGISNAEVSQLQQLELGVAHRTSRLRDTIGEHREHVELLRRRDERWEEWAFQNSVDSEGMRQLELDIAERDAQLSHKQQIESANQARCAELESDLRDRDVRLREADAHTRSRFARKDAHREEFEQESKDALREVDALKASGRARVAELEAQSLEKQTHLREQEAHSHLAHAERWRELDGLRDSRAEELQLELQQMQSRFVDLARSEATEAATAAELRTASDFRSKEETRLQNEVNRLVQEVDASEQEKESLRQVLNKPDPSYSDIMMSVIWCGGRKGPEAEAKYTPPVPKLTLQIAKPVQQPRRPSMFPPPPSDDRSGERLLRTRAI